ncbi:NucA/NucB deoxyribonuclease domain-containing protein [Corynebacterium sp. CTNIH6]|uniref:NucA/NucB deoxyribonuclease domain-containing protein n=1 Tax=Corynebacterium sp. CTNIH6 TaxID=3230066 RepID=UPI003F8D16E9
MRAGLQPPPLLQPHAGRLERSRPTRARPTPRISTMKRPDEFPYAPSRQGGARATVKGVSRSVQRSRGSSSSFYRSNKNGDGGCFREKLTD